MPVDDPGPCPEGCPESVFRAVEEAARGPPETVRSLSKVAVADESFGGLVVAPSFVRKQPSVRDKAIPAWGGDLDNGGQPSKPQDLVVCQRKVGILPTLLLSHRIAIVFRVCFDAQFVGPPANGDFFVVTKDRMSQTGEFCGCGAPNSQPGIRPPVNQVSDKCNFVVGARRKLVYKLGQLVGTPMDISDRDKATRADEEFISDDGGVGDNKLFGVHRA